MFEEDSFAPVAKIKGEKRYSLVADHLGTPTQGYNEEGDLIWERELDSYGKTRMQTGDEGFAYITYQGQVYDKDIELTYNRMRWYDQSEGVYVSSDPIGLEGGSRLYAYVPDPYSWIDILGLSCSEGRKGKQQRLRDLLNDSNTPKHIKGWMKQELNSIERGKRKTIRNPKGYELAHKRGYEAAKGFGYEHSNLQTTDLHRLQHKYDNYGRKNKKASIKI